MFTHRAEGRHDEEERARYIPHLQLLNKARGECFCWFVLLCTCDEGVVEKVKTHRISVQVNDLLITIRKDGKSAWFPPLVPSALVNGF